MTIAVEILRHAEEEPRLRAGFLFERLSILEDRRRVSLFQRALCGVSITYDEDASTAQADIISA